MDEETQKKFDEMEASQKKATEELEAERKGREEDKTTHEKSIAEKDAVIEQKKKDVIGARQKYKKLSDMSDEEKEALTEKERELQERSEAQDKRQEEFEASQKEMTDKETKARLDSVIKTFAGDDEELAGKIKANYERIKDSEQASTQAEISAMASDAFNMLGVPKADGVGNAISTGGDGSVGEANDGNFADTDRGKALAEGLGLSFTKTKEE